MSSNKQLGIYFGSSSLSIVEMQKQLLKNYFDAPHSLFDDTQASSQALSDDIKITAIIQKSLREKKIDATNVCLSLPSKDVILRSFFIPWMTSAEVKGVVDFEARRYIPFKLEELVYSSHAETVMEKNNRRIRILFVGIQKKILEKYNSIIEQSGLKVSFIEPASISLLRMLTFKKLLQKRQRIAIIQIIKNEGTITIVEQNVPQFTRDFRLIPSTAEAFEISHDALEARLLNEVKISFDYYRRQQAGGDIEKIMFLSSNEMGGLTAIIEKELNLPTVALSTRSLLNIEDEVGAGIIYAFGIGLNGALPFPLNLNLTKAHAVPLQGEKVFEQVPVNYLSVILTGAVCAVIILLSLIFNHFTLANAEKKFNQLTKTQGIYESLSEKDLSKERDVIIKKITGYKNIRLNSDIANFLSHVPSLLPDGVWLTSFNIRYTESNSKKSNIDLEMVGSCYLADANKEITQVNTLIDRLRKDKNMANVFDNISLISARKTETDGNSIIAFQIKCD